MIRLNFLPFKNQTFTIAVFRKEHSGDRNPDKFYHSFVSGDGKKTEYEIEFSETKDFESVQISQTDHPTLVGKSIYHRLIKSLPQDKIIIERNTFKNRKIHFILESHPKGKKCVWIEPYYLKSARLWGILLDFHFVVDKDENGDRKYSLDKDILIATGTLNSHGNSNADYYLFKHEQLTKFIKTYLPTINKILSETVDGALIEIESSKLESKNYLFGNGLTSNSSFMGLSKNVPLRNLEEDVKYYFIYKKENRDIAVSLLRGLRGESNPTTFSGMEKLFKTKFSNDIISGASIGVFDNTSIDAEIVKIKALGKNVIPIIITNAKKDDEDDKLYYWLKHKFTNQGIPCQVVTKDLVRNDYSLKYSLSNIGLQIFAKAGGYPWKMKSNGPEYLIIGIGQSYNTEETDEGVKIEKNITYSVLTDSSGLFQDIQVLGEGVENDNYYQQLVSNLVNIINSSGHKKVSIHCPFRMSKPKILEQVVKQIPSDIELSVLVINNKSDFFGYDYNNNGLVPYESTYIKIASNDFLVWFEGLQYNNPKINKRFGNPLLISFWYSNNPERSNDYKYKESLLQDCINLSGANWRGFKAKQLPVSVFYCQRIAEFLTKFKHYNLDHIEINNLKPWFL